MGAASVAIAAAVADVCVGWDLVLLYVNWLPMSTTGCIFVLIERVGIKQQQQQSATEATMTEILQNIIVLAPNIIKHHLQNNAKNSDHQ